MVNEHKQQIIGFEGTRLNLGGRFMAYSMSISFTSNRFQKEVSEKLLSVRYPGNVTYYGLDIIFPVTSYVKRILYCCLQKRCGSTCLLVMVKFGTRLASQNTHFGMYYFNWDFLASTLTCVKNLTFSTLIFRRQHLFIFVDYKVASFQRILGGILSLFSFN